MESVAQFAGELFRRDNIADPNNDQNVGSAREPGGNSVSQFASTLVVNLVVFIVLLSLFILLRRSNRRIYAPRTYVGTVESWRQLQVEKERDEIEGVGGISRMLGWLKGATSIPDETVLRTNGLDGYFFLRYLRTAVFVCFVGCCITFPVLFPLNATGSANQTGLDLLSFSNIGTSSNQKNRLYAHTFISWIFLSFVMFTIYRELVYFTTVRQAYMLTPNYASRISARTLLITTIPEYWLSETKLRLMFDNVKRIWINTRTDELEELIKERDEVVMKLEAAEIKLIKTADAARRKAAKNASDGQEEPVVDAETAAESGSVAAQWLPRKDRPTHRLKPIIGEKVDTIDWCRGKLAELNPRVEEMQATARNGENKMNSAFIEFTSQAAAQVGLQILAHNLPLHMAPRYIGLTPEEIIWSNLKLKWWERLVKFASTTAFVTAMVIFWSVPVAVVGAISQIDYLTKKVTFLSFINDIPPVILGVITGVLPTVMLAVLMALVPIVLRLMAKISGQPSISQVEYRVQNMYFAFQVIQVFLVTTMTSAASSAIPTILKNPGSVTSLLASNIPKASNFYISYMILQGLAVSAGALLQIAGLVVYKLLGWLLDNTPRKQWRRWSSLSGLGWGTVFPVYTNLCVIAITYSVIAPLVMGFATCGIGLMYLAYRYNILFVYNINIDTKGLVYPRALFQTITGIYLAEICMIGLFAIKVAIGPLVLMIFFAVFTVLFHMTLSSAIQPLLDFLPKNLQAEEESLLLTIEDGPAEHEHEQKQPLSPTSPGMPEMQREISQSGSEANVPFASTAEKKPSFFARFLHPEIHESYLEMRKHVPRNLPEVVYTPETERDAYMHPCISSAPPAIWLPRDAGGISRQEVAHTSVVNPVSDRGAILNEKGKVVRDEDANPPDWSEKPHY